METKQSEMRGKGNGMSDSVNSSPQKFANGKAQPSLLRQHTCTRRQATGHETGVTSMLTENHLTRGTHITEELARSSKLHLHR